MSTTRVAVILVAGVGSRLRPLTDSVPKALVSLGEESILGRAIRCLLKHGVEHFVLGTGYKEEAIAEHLRRLKVSFTLCRNDAYATTQNSISLTRCIEALHGEPFFKLDGDVVFVPEVLTRLDACPADLAVAVDGQRLLDEEAMKITCGAQRSVTAFGKSIPVLQANGESIGIERLSAQAGGILQARLQALCSSGVVDRYYEDVYSELLGIPGFSAQCVEVGDLPWTEVDDFTDLERARSLIETSRF